MTVRSSEKKKIKVPLVHSTGSLVTIGVLIVIFLIKMNSEQKIIYDIYFRFRSVYACIKICVLDQ